LRWLNLRVNLLSGNIPKEIGNLKKLEFFDIWANGTINGEIPKEIGNLTKLWRLGLAANSLTGTIPKEIGNCLNLVQLWLVSNSLTGNIPIELGNLQNLASLDLRGNKLSGNIPPELSHLKKLQDLLLAGNNLGDSLLFDTMPYPSLINMIVYDNQLKYLPDLSSLTSLQYLDVKNNKLEFDVIAKNIGIPDSSFIYSPQDSVGLSKLDSICIGNDYKISANAGGIGNLYQWFKNGTPIGQPDTINEMNFTPFKVLNNGDYICEITNPKVNQLTLYSRPVQLRNYPIPQKPTITKTNDTLISSQNSFYKWYYNDSLINGAIEKFYVPKFSGDYQVEITDNNGCSIISDKFNMSFTPEVTLGISSLDANIGDTIEVDIIQKKSKNLLLSGVTSFSGNLEFNSSLIYPIDINRKGFVTNGKRIIPLNIINLNLDTNLLKLKFIVTLGNDASTLIILDSLKGNGVAVIFSQDTGSISIKGICDKGGLRLINSTNAVALMLTKPNPATEEIEIEFSTIEEGRTKISIHNLMGDVVKNAYEGSPIQGVHSKKINISELSDGMYYLIMQTPTEKRVEKFIVNH